MPLREAESSADIVVMGGGTAGSIIAARLAHSSDANVLLVEAGPDYGPLSMKQWPLDVLDARQIPTSHDWSYSCEIGNERCPIERARILGGCSAHNGCVALVGGQTDYTNWAKEGLFMWEWESMKPALVRALKHFRVRTPTLEELQPFQREFLRSIGDLVPITADLNDFTEAEAAGPSPVNIADEVRWNSAFAYLDPIRSAPNLGIVAESIVDRIVIRNGKVAAIEIQAEGRPKRIYTNLAILCCGAYSSPAILLRSGVGSAREVKKLGINPVIDLPGVGSNLRDHPTVQITFEPSEQFDDAMRSISRVSWVPAEQTLAKIRSSDSARIRLHVFPINEIGEDGRFTYTICAGVLDTINCGRVSLKSADPTEPPLIDNRFLVRLENADLSALREGTSLIFEVANRLARRRIIRAATHNCAPGKKLSDFRIRSYCHPTSTCKMGMSTDPLAVVDGRGQVHGVTGLYVCDASIFPRAPRSNTNIPTAMIAERLVREWSETRFSP